LNSEREIQDALEHVMDGRTTLVIAHRLSTIAKADKIVVMGSASSGNVQGKGNVLEEGTHRQLLKNKGPYYKLYNASEN
jgi:ABC-type transport system involved in Fe-S cluster assembly fused permease/ATPase subunit